MLMTWTQIAAAKCLAKSYMYLELNLFEITILMVIRRNALE